MKYKELNKMLQVISKNKKSMGSAIVLSKGKVDFKKSFGFKKQSPDALYRIGSISKTYTAVIIIKLIEEGFLNYTDKLSKFYPKITNSEIITIEHLLRHRSGLVNFTNLPDYLSYCEKPMTERKLIHRFVKNGVNFKPDELYEYSNTGYVLLSFIAQKVSKKKYDELLEKYITIPLKLKNTYIYNSLHPKKEEVISYIEKKPLQWQKATNTHESIPIGAGAIVSSAEEVALFFHFLFKGSLIKEVHLKKMKTLQDNYGLGVLKLPYNRKTGFGHGGSIDGFHSMAGAFDKGNLVIVHLTNANSMDTNLISLGLLGSYYGNDFKIPEFKKIISVPVKHLKKYEGLYISKELPIKINFFVIDSILYGQAENQEKFHLEAYSKSEFGLPTAGIAIKFSEDGTKMSFTQGKTYVFTKK